MTERQFQAGLIRELLEMFPGCIVLKNDAGYIQGIPDLLILYRNTWAALEVKRSHQSSRRPNQDHYISELDEMSFASFICPENKQEVLDELQHAFSFRGATRISKR